MSRFASIRPILRVGLPLAAGALVYGVRQGQTLLLEAIRAALPRDVLGTLPDALWSYAIAQAILLVWASERGLSRFIWLALGFALAMGWELGQGVGVIPGTFDVLDLFASAGGYALALLTSMYGRGSSSCTRSSTSRRLSPS